MHTKKTKLSNDMKTLYETLIEAAKELNHDELVRFLINERREDVDKLFDLAAAKYTEQSNEEKFPELL